MRTGTDLISRFCVEQELFPVCVDERFFRVGVVLFFSSWSGVIFSSRNGVIFFEFDIYFFELEWRQFFEFELDILFRFVCATFSTRGWIGFEFDFERVFRVCVGHVLHEFRVVILCCRVLLSWNARYSLLFLDLCCFFVSLNWDYFSKP